MMNQDDLIELIKQGENETVDFKRIYHENKAELIHDILCLANASISKRRDRMIVFGVSDSGEITGVQSDKNRRTSVKINDLLSGANLNTKLLVRVETHSLENNIEVDVLVIDDRPQKPYFLKKDYGHNENEKKMIVRAGVVYSRRGSRNTAISGEGIDDHELENMFAERLGLDLPAIDRLKDYLKDPNSWEKFYDGPDESYYYSVRPEFYFLIKKDKCKVDLSNEPWAVPIIFGEADRYICIFKYHTTAIDRLEILKTTNGNYSMCWPKENDRGQYYFKRTSKEYILSCFLREKSMRGGTYDFERLEVLVID